jgi:tetratricopeptide (TPR) repeat protein
MCYLGLGFRVRARSYLDRFAERRRGSPWGTAAAFESLKTRIDSLDDAGLEATAGEIVPPDSPPTQRIFAVDALEELARGFASQGSFERALLLVRCAYRSAGSDSRHADRLAPLVAGWHIAARRYAELLRFFPPPALARLDRPLRDRVLLAHSLAHAALGRYGRARATLRVPGRSREPLVRMQSVVREAVIAQASGDLPGALSIYRSILRRFGDLPPALDAATSCAAQLLALCGAHEASRRAEREWKPPPTAPTVHRRPYLRWSLDVIENRFDVVRDGLAERLSERPAGDRDTVREHLLLCILHELTGDAARAAHGLETLEKTYAKGELWRWCLPVSFLLGRATADDLWRNVRRYELFLDIGSSSLYYLLGVVMRRRRDEGSARELFRLAVKDDPLNYWPAVLARRELGTLTPKMRAFLA